VTRSLPRMLPTDRAPRDRSDDGVMRYIHMDVAGCGLPAFALIRKPERTDALESRLARHIDGKMINPGTNVVCDSCGNPVRVNIAFVVDTVRAAKIERDIRDRPPRPGRGRP